MTLGFGKRFVVPALAAMVFNVVGCGGAAPETDASLVEQARAAAARAEETGQAVVSTGVLSYNAGTREVYVNEGERVMRLEGEQLVDVMGEAPRSQGQVKALDVCSNTDNLSHCETVVCGSGYLYRNYNASTDSFADPFATVYSGQTLNIRNAPYRRYGPRAVRVFNSGIWGFVSANCVSGGF